MASKQEQLSGESDIEVQLKMEIVRKDVFSAGLCCSKRILLGCDFDERKEGILFYSFYPKAL